MSKKKLIILIIAFLFILLGFIGFIGTALINFGALSYNGELPNSSISGIAVDSKGNIYLGLEAYGKVQVYDKEGNFIRNWQIHANGGAFKMRKGNGDNIEIITARGNKIISYDQNGKIISGSNYRNEDEFNKSYSVTFCKDTFGNTYEVTGFMFYSIVKNGKTDKPIICQGFLHHILQGPMPAWLFFAFGLIIILVYQRKTIKGKLKNRA